MISLHKILIGFWILAGLLALVAGVKILHVPESRERILEQIREIAEELKIKEEDCMCRKKRSNLSSEDARMKWGLPMRKSRKRRFVPPLLPRLWF